MAHSRTEWRLKHTGQVAHLPQDYSQNVNKDIQCLSPAKNGEYNRTREKWQLSDKLFEIATRAVSDDRTKRQQSIRQFTAEWEAAQ